MRILKLIGEILDALLAGAILGILASIVIFLAIKFLGPLMATILYGSFIITILILAGILIYKNYDRKN